MQDLNPAQQLNILLNEVIEKRVFVSISFAIIALAIMVVGLFWPKVYESSSSIQWSNINSVSPILNQQRNSRDTTISEQAGIASEIILSNKILDKLIKVIGLEKNSDDTDLSLTELQLVKDGFRSKISVERQGPNLFTVSYKHKSAERAHIVIKTITDLFLEETQAVKNEMSQGAYDFIDSQVMEYKAKLESINKLIIDFRKENVDLDSDTSSGVNSRVNDLKLTIREANLELTEAKVQMQSLEDQLAKERQSIEKQLLTESYQVSSEERTSLNVERLKTLQANLDNLRLSYTESYPDIVQLKEQIKTLLEQIEAEETNLLPEITDESMSTASNKSIRFVESPLYTRLTSEISAVQTTLRTLEARVSDAENRLANELLRASEVNEQESLLEEMARDLDVTQRIYNDLLTRRENARVSLNLQLENQGSSFKVQEPATLPLVPVGLRFLHFSLLSIPAGLGFPLAIIIGLLLIDQRIRHEDSVKLEGYDIPVIGIVGQYLNDAEQKREKQKNMVAIATSVVAVISITLIITLKVSQVIGA